ncbi:hypothetical protein FOA52_009143 [Chlamydomonas sp. UWO 241]|nr:hypothetical protein FOA52_009143 [Chlamydomonas sp. UWO 241]
MEWKQFPVLAPAPSPSLEGSPGVGAQHGGTESLHGAPLPGGNDQGLPGNDPVPGVWAAPGLAGGRSGSEGAARDPGSYGAASSASRSLLGEAACFVVLAGVSVTSSGASVLRADLGVFPGTSVTGFPPGQMVGGAAIYASDVGGRAAAGIRDLTTAYNDAASRTLCAAHALSHAFTGNLGGMTLMPGLYKSTSGFGISGSDLILDALGDPDAVFIFQARAACPALPWLGE